MGRYSKVANFKKQLEVGKTGETEIAKWLMSRGFNVLPIYEIAEGQFKGPALFSSGGENIIAPDMLVFRDEKILWVEAKHKEAFTYHRITKRFVTGIDLHHYGQYRKINSLVAWPVWLLFLHRGGAAKDSEKSKSGLFGGELSYLETCENHRHDNWGKSGMVYWAEDKLKKLSDYPLPV